MRRRVRQAAYVLPAGALHYCVTGDILDRVEGVARFGSAFDEFDAFFVPQGGDELAAYAEQHRADINRHARALGVSQPWIFRQLTREGTTT